MGLGGCVDNRRQGSRKNYAGKPAVQSRGFTLLELLTVVAIISLLLGITLPSLGHARRLARRAQCSANLRSIGHAVQGYVNDNNGFYPPMAPMPTLEIGPNPRPRMCDVLDSFVGGQEEVFQCPDDYISNPSQYVPQPTVQRWHQWQGSSYEPRMNLSVVFGGKLLLSRENYNILDPTGTFPFETWEQYVGNAAKVLLLHDYEAFHGPVDQPMSRMTLYADFHVSGMAKYPGIN